MEASLFVLALFALVILGFILYFVPVGLWIAAYSSGAYVGIGTLIAMRLRRVPPGVIVKPRISAVKAGLSISVDELEAHYLAGGNVERVVNALISADKAGMEITFARATAIDLAGRDVLEAVQMSVNPKVITTPKVAAVAKDGIQLIAQSRVTVRADLDRLVGGAGEETIVARVGEGVVSTIGSAESHKKVLENPDEISKTVLSKGLEARHGLFRSSQSTLPKWTWGPTSAPNCKQSRRRPTSKSPRPLPKVVAPMAVAQEQEMKARVHEMRAKVVEAEAEIPLGHVASLPRRQSGGDGLLQHEERRLGYQDARFHFTVRRAGRGPESG